MVLSERGGHQYGDSPSDVHDEIRGYSTLNGYPASAFADARCACGGARFRLSLDDTVGAAVRTCTGCGIVHPMADSDEYLDGASLEECACPCGREEFEISVGVALYQASEDVRWLYLGCRCAACGLTAVYGDWKNESPGYRTLLARV